MSLLKSLPKIPTVFFPQELVKDMYSGKLLGYLHPSTSIFNIVCTDEFPNPNAKDINQIGVIINKHTSHTIDWIREEYTSNDLKLVSKPEVEFGQILAVREGDRITFFTSEGIICKQESYSLVIDLFSRNTGILESEFMLDKSVLIAGCGSVGSLVALELARSGVGKFLLVDSDILSYHNLCRHQCGIADVGKYKVDAVEERILQINSTAKILKHVGIIETVTKEVFEEFCNTDTLIIGCADNREGDLYANNKAKSFKCSFMSIGFMKRAFAGEIFYSLYNSAPCYNCLYEARENISLNTVAGSKRIYDGDTEHFEPGISADISFVTIVGVKIALDILNLKNPNFHTRLLNDLSHFTWICNTNNVAVGGDEAEFFSYPLQITTSMEVGFAGECKQHQRCKLYKE
jgi:hypothetical protein